MSKALVALTRPSPYECLYSLTPKSARIAFMCCMFTLLAAAGLSGQVSYRNSQSRLFSRAESERQKNALPPMLEPVPRFLGWKYAAHASEAYRERFRRQRKGFVPLRPEQGLGGD